MASLVMAVGKESGLSVTALEKWLQQEFAQVQLASVLGRP